MVDLLWSVAAEGRWLGAEIPFDREARRSRYAAAIEASSSTVLVADAGPRPAGGGVVGEISVAIAPYGVADLSMMVARAWRGRGAGRRLLDAGLAWASRHGAHKAWLEVWPDNEAAIALYRRAGFVEEGRKVAHYRRADGALWDALLMGRPLDPPAG